LVSEEATGRSPDTWRSEAQATDGARRADRVLLRRSARCVDRVLQQISLDAQFHS
jgi:hypothetical protein